MKIVTGRITLEGIKCNGKSLRFLYPPIEGSINEITEKLDSMNLRMPSSAEIASVINACVNFNSREDGREYASKVVYALRWNGIEFTGCMPSLRGIYFEDNPQIVDGKVLMNERSLIKRLENPKEIENVLFSPDEKVRFVPFGFKRGDVNSRKLEKNPYILARYGLEGRKKISEYAISVNSWDRSRIDSDIENPCLCRLAYDSGGMDVGDGLIFTTTRFRFNDKDLKSIGIIKE